MKIEKVEKISGRVKNKTRKGGMSANRYDRLREGQLNDFYKKVGEKLNKDLLPIIDDVDYIIFGGNPIRAEDFLKTKILDYRLAKKVIPEIISVSSIDEVGLEQSKKEVARILKDSSLAEEMQAWNEFMSHLLKMDVKVSYGPEAKTYLENGQVDTLLVLDDYDIEFLKIRPRRIICFSYETEWGQQLKAFGSIAAILRW